MWGERLWGEKAWPPLSWLICRLLSTLKGFPGGSAGKESACSAGDLGLILGLGRFPGAGKGYSLQYSDLEDSMDCIVYVNIHSCHFLLDHFQFALIHEPNIPGSYAILLFTASDPASITSHIHNWVLFLLWLHPFILSGVISPLISSSILGTYWPGEFLFQCPIFLPFHTVHGVLKARIMKWFAIPFSSGPHSVRPLHHDLPVLGGPTRHSLVSLS